MRAVNFDGRMQHVIGSDEDHGELYGLAAYPFESGVPQARDSLATLYSQPSKEIEMSELTDILHVSGNPLCWEAAKCIEALEDELQEANRQTLEESTTADDLRTAVGSAYEAAIQQRDASYQAEAKLRKENTHLSEELGTYTSFGWKHQYKKSQERLEEAIPWVVDYSEGRAMIAPDRTRVTEWIAKVRSYRSTKEPHD